MLIKKLRGLNTKNIRTRSMGDPCTTSGNWSGRDQVVVVIDLPLLRVAVEGSDNPVSLEKPCQASLPPDQQGRHSLGRHPEVQYVA